MFFHLVKCLSEVLLSLQTFFLLFLSLVHCSFLEFEVLSMFLVLRCLCSSLFTSLCHSSSLLLLLLMSGCYTYLVVLRHLFPIITVTRSLSILSTQSKIFSIHCSSSLLLVTCSAFHFLLLTPTTLCTLIHSSHQLTSNLNDTSFMLTPFFVLAHTNSGAL